MSLDPRLAGHLQRLGQADRALRDQGRDPESFLLVYAGAMTREILHPAWDDSWATPVAEDVDDLAELAYVRLEPVTNGKRLFALAVAGREQAAVLAEPPRTYVGGRAPELDETLDWLAEQAKDAPERFEVPTRLIDEAVASGFVPETGRNALAGRILALRDQGFLSGLVPQIDQATDEQRLGRCDGLSLTMKAHDRANPVNAGNTVNFNGSVIANQIAAGDITNYATFDELLDRAKVELGKLEDIDQSDRDEALNLVEFLRGRALSAGAEVMTGAGGALLAGVMTQLLGLPRLG